MLPKIRLTDVSFSECDSAEEIQKHLNDLYRIDRAQNQAILKLLGKGHKPETGKRKTFGKAAGLIFLLVLLCCSVSQGAISWRWEYAQNADDMEKFMLNPDFGNMSMDTITFANGGTFENSTNNVFEINENSEDLLLTFSSNAIAATSTTGVVLMNWGAIVTAGNQVLLNPVASAVGTAEGTLYYDSDVDEVYVRKTSGWVALGTGTFTGGSITGDIVMANGIYLQSSETTAQASAIQVWDTTAVAAYTNVMSWTNGAIPDIVLGAATNTLAVVSTGLNVSSAGAVTGVTDLTASGAISTGVLTTTGVVTLGNNTAALSIASTGIDISTAGAITNATDLTLTGDITMATDKGVKSSVTTAHTVGVYGYDVGVGYVGALVVTNSATPATVLGNTSGTTAISSSDWTVSTAGNAAGLGTITSDGLLTVTGGETITGTISINDSATTSTTSIGAGTTTGAVTVGGTGTQTVSVGNGAGIKTVALGSATTSSTTTIKGGSNGVNINTGTFDDPTNINTGLNTGTVTIGGTGAMTIAIGNGGTGAKVVSLGDDAGASSLALKAGTSDMTITSIDDMTINGGSAGSIINIGTNTQGNVINIATDDTTLDDLNIGSVKDTVSVTGIDVTIVSGATGVLLNNNTNQLVNIATGTSTGTVSIGTGDTAQTVTIANGAGVKTVTLGSTDTTSITTISGGSAGLALNGPVAINTSKATNTTSIGAGTTTGAITIGGTGTQTIGVGNGAGIKTVTLGSVTSTSATVINSGTGDLDIIATAILDIDVGTTMDILVAGAFSIDGGAASSNISLAADGDGDDFTISVTGAHDSSLKLASAGTGTDAIKISTSNAAGDIDIDSADDMTVDVVGDLTITTTGTLSLAASAITNVKRDIEVVDANDTITAAESGKCFVSIGLTGVAASNLVLTLPTAAAGLEYYFYDANAVADDDLWITCGAADTINGGTAQKSYKCTGDAVKQGLHIVAQDATSWLVLSEVGTWENDNN